MTLDCGLRDKFYDTYSTGFSCFHRCVPYFVFWISISGSSFQTFDLSSLNIIVNLWISFTYLGNEHHPWIKMMKHIYSTLLKSHHPLVPPGHQLSLRMSLAAKLQANYAQLRLCTTEAVPLDDASTVPTEVSLVLLAAKAMALEESSHWSAGDFKGWNRLEPNSSTEGMMAIMSGCDFHNGCGWRAVRGGQWTRPRLRRANWSWLGM